MNARRIVIKLRAYWALLKGWQAGLLLVTGIAGYMSASCPITTWQRLLALGGSLFLAIAGSTVLNMVYDRDIDAKMKRSCRRPIPSGVILVRQALPLGLILAAGGVSWAFVISPLYGLVVFTGLFFNVVVYTMWLKRRTPWSIVVGGIAGGMPILAGRVLGTGQIDSIGLLLAIAVLFWIPTHIVTFNLKYAEDYRRAGVPVFPNTYGEQVSRLIIGISTGAAAMAMVLAVWHIELRGGYLQVMVGLSLVLLGFAVVTLLRASPKLNFALFKMASLYMLISMLAIILGA